MQPLSIIEKSNSAICALNTKGEDRHLLSRCIHSMSDTGRNWVKKGCILYQRFFNLFCLVN